MGIKQECLKKINHSLQSQQLDAWLIVGHETTTNNDPTLSLISDYEFIGYTAMLFQSNGRVTIICTPIDKEGYLLDASIDEVIEFKETFEQTLHQVLKELNIKHLAINTHESQTIANGLTYGVYQVLKEAIKDLNIEVISAWPLIEALTK